MTAVAARGRSLSVRAVRVHVHAAAIPALLVTTVAIVGSIWWGYLGLRRADGLATSAFDQAYFQQLVWSVSRGEGFVSSFNPGDFLGLHFSPLLVVPAALQAVWPDARLLTVLQVVALGLAVPAAFVLVRAILRPAREAGWVAAALTLPMIAWPIIQQQPRADFHTEALALPLVLLAGWAGLTRRPLVMYLAALVALTAKEDQVFPVAVVGLLVAARAGGPSGSRAWRTGSRRHGLALVGLAGGWAVVVFGVIKPFLRDGVRYDTDPYYAWLGQGTDILRVPFDQTEALIGTLTRPAGWIVVGWLLLSLGGVALLRPRWLALLVPPVLAHLLSRQIPQHQIALQYGLLLLVPAIVASALGARRALAWWRRRVRHARARSPLARTVPIGIGLVVIFGLGVGSAVGGGSVPPFGDAQRHLWDRPAAIDRVRAIAATVPVDAPLAVDWGLASAVASRRHIEILSWLTDDAYILLDADPYVSGSVRWKDRTTLVMGLPSSGRTLLIDDGRFSLWGPLDG